MPNYDTLLGEIAELYSDKDAALALLQSKIKSQVPLDKLIAFRDDERELNRKRVHHKVPRTINLLKLALDNTTFSPGGNHKARFPSYQGVVHQRGRN